jgi:hypothetical protein
MGRQYKTGYIPWNKGLKMPEGFCAKLREAQKKVVRSSRLSAEETRVRKEARERGDKYYIYPRPCAKGHLAKRSIRNTECFQCHVDSAHERRRLRSKSEREFKMYHSAKQRAREGGLEFSIKRADINNIWPKDNKCPILGIELQSRHGMGPQRQSPSLDRIDPKKGYVVGNIAVISYKANCIKQDETNPLVFESLARWLRANQKDKEMVNAV